MTTKQDAIIAGIAPTGKAPRPVYLCFACGVPFGPEDLVSVAIPISTDTGGEIRRTCHPRCAEEWDELLLF